MTKARLLSILDRAHPRICVAFWVFGLINNVLYVLILSSALDLVGPSLPKALVLLFDVVPSFITKLFAPYFIHHIPYAARILLFSLLSATGMLLVALTPAYTTSAPTSPDAGAGSSVATKMAGVVLASIASGGGELSFLGLTHFFGPASLAAWGSGTGAAGLVGAGAYTLATTVLGFSVRNTLLVSSFLPAVMIVAFFLLLPRGPLRQAAAQEAAYQRVPKGGEENSRRNRQGHASDGEGEDYEAEVHGREDEGLLTPPPKYSVEAGEDGWFAALTQNLCRARSLFFPFMLPLLFVYVAEYTINQGVAPTLLFPLTSTPFKHFRAFYPAYNALYQVGVFISRSSTPFFRVHNLYLPSLLQILNLLLLTAHAIFDFLPNVYFIFAIMFWEGLLGGLVYVNTFAEILDTVPEADREFSLGATSVSDSGGICLAGFIGMALEVGLCTWQVDHGRPYCRQL